MGNNNTYFSLYALEAWVGENKTGLKGQDYHSFLAMVDETPGRTPKIVAELHFTMQRNGLAEGQKPYLHAVTKTNTERDLSELEMLGYIGGDIEVMRPVWEHALDVGFEIGQLQKEFSTSGAPSGINCRAGVKAVIDSLGLEYRPAIEGNDAVAIGTESNLAEEIPNEARLCDFEL